MPVSWRRKRAVPTQGSPWLRWGNSWQRPKVVFDPAAGEWLHGRVWTRKCAVRSSVPSLLRRLSCVSRALEICPVWKKRPKRWWDLLSVSLQQVIETSGAEGLWERLWGAEGWGFGSRSGYFLGFRKGMLACLVYTHFSLLGQQEKFLSFLIKVTMSNISFQEPILAETGMWAYKCWWGCSTS